MTTRFADHLLEGDHASRPTATTVPTGTLYACSDHNLIYQSDGSTWSTWSGSGGASSVLTTEGDLLYHDGAGLQRLPYDADDKVLTGVAGVPAWADATAGGGSGDGVDLTGPDDYAFGASAAIDTLPGGWSFDRTGAGATRLRYQEDNGRGVISQVGAFTLFQGIYRSLPVGFATGLFRASCIGGTGNEGFGPFLREAATGKAAHMTMRANATQQLTFYSSTGSVGSDFTGSAWAAGPVSDWYFKIVRNSSSSWDWYAGPSPVMLDPLFSAINVPTATNGFTPDQIGFGFLTAGGGLKVAAIDYLKLT